MKIVHMLILLFAALALVACNTVPTQATDQGSVIKTNADGSKIENLSDYALYAKTVTDSKPIFEMTCPPQGCVMLSLKVNAPNNKNSLQAPVAPETVGMAFTKGLFGLAHDVIGLGPWYFGSKVLTTAFDKANSSVTTTTIDNSNRSTNSDSSNRSVTNTTTTTTTTNTTTNTNTNSNNRTCTSGQAGNGAGTTTGGAGGASGSPSC